MLINRAIPFVVVTFLLALAGRAEELVISEQETATYTANPKCAKIKVSGKLESADKESPLVHSLTGRFRCADEQESYLVINRNGSPIVLKAKDSVVVPERPNELKKILFEVGIVTRSFSSVCENIKEKGKFLPRDVKGTLEINDAQRFRCESEKGEGATYYIFSYSGNRYLISSDDVVVITN